jgi:hypothetical protein
LFKWGRWEIIKSNRGSEFDQSTLYAYMGISQSNHFFTRNLYELKKEKDFTEPLKYENENKSRHI